MKEWDKKRRTVIGNPSQVNIAWDWTCHTPHIRHREKKRDNGKVSPAGGRHWAVNSSHQSQIVFAIQVRHWHIFSLFFQMVSKNNNLDNEITTSFLILLFCFRIIWQPNTNKNKLGNNDYKQLGHNSQTLPPNYWILKHNFEVLTHDKLLRHISS